MTEANSVQKVAAQAHIDILSVNPTCDLCIQTVGSSHPLHVQIDIDAQMKEDRS